MTDKKIKKLEEDANKVSFILNDGSRVHLPVSWIPTDEMEDLYSEIIGKIICSKLTSERACDLAGMIGDCGPGDIKLARRMR
jgi:hypothetical protein